MNNKRSDLSPDEMLSIINEPFSCTSDHHLSWLLKKARAGNLACARSLYSDLAKMLLCRDQKDLTPFARRTIARLFIRLSKPGRDILKDVKLKPGRGNTRENHFSEQVNIVGDMLLLIEPNYVGVNPGEEPAIERAKMKPGEAAKLIADSGAYPGKTKKTIWNIYNDYKRDPLGFIPD